ncbi:nucleotide kinase [Klebsiella phage VLCpiA1c]|nr:nucleotide kinase [Klebsiella phage VLCpiA1c]
MIVKLFKAGDTAQYTGTEQLALVGCTVEVTGYVHDLVVVSHKGVSRLVKQNNLCPIRLATAGEQVPDAVNSPKHYQFFPDLEAISVIAMCMTQEQFYGYCLGNRLKYRLRAGNKDKLEQDIAKSDKYLELFEQHKGLCHE